MRGGHRMSENRRDCGSAVWSPERLAGPTGRQHIRRGQVPLPRSTVLALGCRVGGHPCSPTLGDPDPTPSGEGRRRFLEMAMTLTY